MKGLTALMTATVLGGALGAGLAMLYAPQSGPETRRRLRQSWDDLQGLTQTQIEQGRVRATELIQTGQERATSMANRMQEAINTMGTKRETPIEPIEPSL